MRRALLLTLVCALSACTASDDYDSRRVQLALWSEHYQKQAETGTMKWSAYYRGLYAHFYFIPELPSHEYYLRWTAALIETAAAFEVGKLSKDEFVSFQNKMNSGMRNFMAGSQLKKSDEQIVSFDRALRPLEAQALTWYGRPIKCVATEFNRVYSATCD